MRRSHAWEVRLLPRSPLRALVRQMQEIRRRLDDLDPPFAPRFRRPSPRLLVAPPGRSRLS